MRNVLAGGDKRTLWQIPHVLYAFVCIIMPPPVHDRASMGCAFENTEGIFSGAKVAIDR